MLMWIFLIVVLTIIVKLVYDVQQKKKMEKVADELCQTEAEFELKDKFQTLAGINKSETHNFSEAQIEGFKELANKWSKVGFPEPDPSIPVVTAKLTTIETKFEDSDPLSTIPLSKVSKKAKQRMAEIAKEDIKQQVEKQASIFPEEVEYTDEYFKPQYIKNEPSENDQRLGVELVKEMMKAPMVKPKKRAKKSEKK